MKEFNLEAALNGEPVMLRSGCKAIIYYKVPDEYKFADNKPVFYPLKGLMFDVNGNLAVSAMYWHASGKFDSKKDHSLDIIGMWEEPKKQTKKQISIEDLPKPFKPKDGESYFYITGGIVEYEDDYWDSNKFDKSSAERGSCYRTREDAQKWLDFMKSMME